MDKTLRVLAIIILILAIVAMVFAQLSFMKRQVLLERNKIFEDKVVQVAKTLEAADAPDVPAPDLQKDVAEVADRELANPDRNSVFENYPFKYETPNNPTLDYSDKRGQLRSYYVLDAEGKYKLSDLDKKPIKDGPGSMAAIMEEFMNRAIAQKAALEKTRAELTKMRGIVTDLVNEMNKMKADWRVTKRELTESRAEVAKLKEEKAALEAKVARLEEEKKELEAKLADANAEIEKRDADIAGLKDKVEHLEKVNKELKRVGRRPDGDLNSDGVAVAKLTAGVKGKIVEANDEYKFVIIEFTDDAMAEMIGADRQKPLPQLEMNVRRTGRQSASGEFITRVKIRQAVRGKNLVVADILTDWQQAPLEKADVVFF